MQAQLISRALQLGVSLCLAACADTHAGTCTLDGCREGETCVRTEYYPTGSCMPVCEWGIDGPRCDNGAWCLSGARPDFCYAGGPAIEGETTDISALSCGFGLIGRRHYDEEPLRRTCEPVCDTDADCRTGERCSPGPRGGSCDVPCEGPGSTPCAPPNRCVTGFCVNERRFAAMDCNGDGVVHVVPTGCPVGMECDCRLGLVCDEAAPGGCRLPEPGTE